MRFLHVDPNHDYRRILGNRLVGHELVSCATLDEARNALWQSQDNPFNLVITNGFIDGESDGWAWATLLHSAGTPVLVLTNKLRLESHLPMMSKHGVVTEESILSYVR